MEFKPIEVDRILRDDPDADLYVFTCRPDLSGLLSSIESAGILVAPLLQQLAAGTYRVVCGSSRIEAIRQLGRRKVDAFVAYRTEMGDGECLARSILENRWHRGFNEVEKALLFTRLKDRFEPLLPRLTDALGEDLKVPQDEGALEAYRFLLSLPEPIRRSVALGELNLAQALLLKGLPEPAAMSFARLMCECGLTIQESRNAAAWIREIAAREGKEPEELIDEQTIQEAFNGASAPRERARRVLALLNERRHPLLESWRARFAIARSRISGPEGGIRVSHDPTFETTRIGVQIQAASETEFNQRLAILSEAAEQGKIAKLFQALSVDPEEPSRSG